ncbi:MAG: aminotransferase class V-fold PLP-dependent enzyme [bacterium]|nr:MAG: aminotransferase class V-fold PLP-dependent enzyme [bacterium]
MNNAATSWPKPEPVIGRLMWGVTELSAAPGRAGSPALESERAIFEAREEVAKFIGARDSSRVVFTLNATAALNLAIGGLVRAGDRVITTSMDHNSVARPLARAAEEMDVEVVRVTADEAGELQATQILDEIDDRTRMIILTHASNVTGAIQPVEEIAEALSAREGSRPLLLVDAAQSAGVLPIDVDRSGIDLLAAPGHKSLYGPQGTGILYVGEGADPVPLMEGGTGGESTLVRQPTSLPDRYESGTPNIPGIVALGEAVRFIGDRGIDTIRAHENRLMGTLIEGLAGVRGVRLFGPCRPDRQVAVLSFTVEGMDPAEVGTYLERTEGIVTRVGLHCSPHSHRTIGTYPEGTIRVSPGIFNVDSDILSLVRGVERLAARRSR